MSFVVYFIVLVITAGSVLFGLDWMHAPMSPMPQSRYELHAAKEPAAPKPPPLAAAETKPAPVPVSQPEPAKTAEVPPPAPIARPNRRRRAATTQMRHRCLYRRLSFVQCGGLHLSAFRRPTPALREGHAAGSRRRKTTQQETTPPDARAQATCNVAACSAGLHFIHGVGLHLSAARRSRRLCEK